MDLSHLSPEFSLLTKDDKVIEFKQYGYNEKGIPSPKDCEAALKGIRLSYAFCGEQDFGIEEILKRFGAMNKNGIITRIPEGLSITTSGEVKAIKFGNYIKLDSEMIKRANTHGIIGYWDYESFIICASKEYEFIINSIQEMFKPKHLRFALNRSFAGFNFIILAI